MTTQYEGGRNANRQEEGERARKAAQPGLAGEDFGCTKNLISAI